MSGARTQPDDPTSSRICLGDSENISALLMTLLGLDDRSDSAVGAIAMALGLDVIEGRLAPGADLNSVELARRFTTSRTPVREALRLLEKEHLVEMPARRRPRVAPIEAKPAAEIYRVRAALVGLLSELICERVTDDELAELRERYATMREAADAGDVDAYFWANVWFGERTVEIAGDDTLRQILASLGVRVLRLRHLSMSMPNRLAQSVDDRGRLLRAYEERDAELAAALHRSIILGALHALERFHWGSRKVPPAIPGGRSA